MKFENAQVRVIKPTFNTGILRVMAIAKVTAGLKWASGNALSMGNTMKVAVAVYGKGIVLNKTNFHEKLPASFSRRFEHSLRTNGKTESKCNHKVVGVHGGRYYFLRARVNSKTYTTKHNKLCIREMSCRTKHLLRRIKQTQEKSGKGRGHTDEHIDESTEELCDSMAPVHLMKMSDWKGWGGDIAVREVQSNRSHTQVVNNTAKHHNAHLLSPLLSMETNNQNTNKAGRWWWLKFK